MRQPLGAFSIIRAAEMTLPWEVPPDTIVVEQVDGRWHVVPHRRRVEIFATREEALACARRIAALFMPQWKIVERAAPGSEARLAWVC